MVQIEPVDPHDEAALRDWFDVVCAARALDSPHRPGPSWAWHREVLTTPWPGQRCRAWLARVHGVAAGVAVLELPQLDNTDHANAEIHVAPRYRRGGIGTRLLALLADEARSAGRVRLGLEAHTPLVGPSPVRRSQPPSGRGRRWSRSAGG